MICHEPHVRIATIQVMQSTIPEAGFQLPIKSHNLIYVLFFPVR